MATENLSQDLAIRRKRLTFRSWHRGFKENDLLLGSFADTHIADMDEGQLDRYEVLLEQPDADLFGWMTGGLDVPAEFDHDVMKLLQDFKFFEQKPWRT